jgi:hypothetical protein
LEEEEKTRLNESIQKVRETHFKVKEVKKDEEGNPIPDEEGSGGPIGLLPDIISDAKQWQWAGVAFGEEVLMLLQKSLKAHC